MSEAVSTSDNGLFFSKKRKLPTDFGERSTSAQRQRVASGLPESSLSHINTLQDSIAQYTTTESVTVQRNRLDNNTSRTGTLQIGTSQSEVPQSAVPVNEHKAKPLNLFDLPAEIRIQIYELALVERDMQVWPGQDKAPRTSIVRRFDRIYRDDLQQSSVITPALLAVNSQICREALPILYSQPFHFSQVTTLEEFLGAIGANLSLVKHIVLQKWNTNGFPVKITNRLFRLGKGSGLRLSSFTFRLHDGELIPHPIRMINCSDSGDKLVKDSEMTKGLVKHYEIQTFEGEDDCVLVYVQVWLPGTV